MAGSLYRRQLDATTLSANWKQAKEDVLDAGAYRSLEVQFRRLKAGTAGKLQLWHAASNEEEAFKLLTSIEAPMDGTGDGNTFVSCDHFLRFLRLQTDANVAGSPVAVVDIVAKA